MDRHELESLATPEAVRLLAELSAAAPSDDELVRTVTRLRREGHDPATVAAVLTQVRLRRRAHAKFGAFADGMLFTDAGLQQATRLSVAAHHAGRFRAAGIRRVADLGCGIGADSLALASLDLEVLAVDADETTAAVAAYNLAPFERARVACARAEEVALDGVDGVWLDPARRSVRGGTTRRLADPDDWSPSLGFAFGLARTRPTGVKLGPAIPHELLPDDAEAQWVSVDGSVVEATVWAGGLERPGVRTSALVMSTRAAGATAAGHGGDGDAAGDAGAPGAASGSVVELTGSAASADADVVELGEYLYEPDGAVIRARLIGDLARSLDAGMIAPEIAWMTASSYAPTPFAQAFRVREVLPLHASALKKELRARGIGALEIKKRGVDVDPAAFRTKLALRGDASATLILTRVGERRVAILADRMP